MSRSAAFWDRAAERYARRPIADEATYRRKLDLAREYLRPDMRVLEIGCGTGLTAIALAPWVSHIRATDASSNMLNIARRRAADANVHNVSFEQVFAEDLDEPDASIDSVLALSVLHLLDDREAVVADVYRMLVPGGYFITNTVCLGDRSVWLRIVARLGALVGLLPSIRFLSRQELENGLVGAGFELLQSWRPNDGMAVFVVAARAESR